MAALRLNNYSASCSLRKSCLTRSIFFCCSGGRLSRLMPSFRWVFVRAFSNPALLISSDVIVAVPGFCILGSKPICLLSLANEKLSGANSLMPTFKHKEAPGSSAETCNPGQRFLTRRGERNCELFVLDLGSRINGRIHILSKNARHIKGEGAGKLSGVKKVNLLEHGLAIEKARLILSEGKGLKAWPKPDEYLVGHCAQLNYLEKAEEVAYDEDSVVQRMHAMATLMHLEEGYLYLRDSLENKPGYNKDLIDEEWQDVLNLKPGPRYCAQMKQCNKSLCNGCEYESLKAPIKIQTDEFIETEATGFWECTLTKQGDLKPVRPAYQDLLKRFQLDHSSVSISDSGLIYTYNGTHYELMENLELKSYAQAKLNPKPSERQRTEFLSLVRVHNLKSSEWFNHQAEGLINLANGVYDMRKEKLLPHSKDFGFRYCLPYNYEPEAECPVFEQFLLDVTKTRLDIVSVLQEFMGYSIAGGPCYGEKALILYGEGSNGKSTYMRTLKALAGEDNYSSLSLTALNKDTKRYQLDGALFNIGEETNVKALGESEIFKTMVDGGEIDVKKLYVQDYRIENRCKLIMACNELPKSQDRSFGLYRRMLLIPFEAKFDGKNKDKFIGEKIQAELPGIFNFAMQGYKRLIDNKYVFTEGQSLIDAIESYKIENDNVLGWAVEHIKITDDDDDYLFKDDMYHNYKEWTTEEGTWSVTKKTFFSTLYKTYPALRESKRVEPGLTNKKKRVLVGIRKVEL